MVEKEWSWEWGGENDAGRDEWPLLAQKSFTLLSLKMATIRSVVVVSREEEGGEKEEESFVGRNEEAGLVRGGKGAFFSASLLVAGSLSRVYF